MSTIANTRLFKDSVLKVDDLAAGWIEGPEAESCSGFGAPSNIIDTVSASSSIGDEGRPDLPDGGDATYMFYSNLDDEFQQTMRAMWRDPTDERTFKIVLAEGTKDTGTFTAWVSNVAVTAEKRNVVKVTISLVLNSRVVWATT